MGMSREGFLRECAGLYEDADAFLAKMSSARGSLKALTPEIEQERPVTRLVRWASKPIDLPDGMGELITLTELEHHAVSAVSGRYSVVPPIASPRPARAANARGGDGARGVGLAASAANPSHHGPPRETVLPDAPRLWYDRRAHDPAQRRALSHVRRPLDPLPFRVDVPLGRG